MEHGQALAGELLGLVAAGGTREHVPQCVAFYKSRVFEFGASGNGPSALAANILGLLLRPREA